MKKSMLCPQWWKKASTCKKVKDKNLGIWKVHMKPILLLHDFLYVKIRLEFIPYNVPFATYGVISSYIKKHLAHFRIYVIHVSKILFMTWKVSKKELVEGRLVF